MKMFHDHNRRTVFTFEAGEEVAGSAVSSCAETGLTEYA